MDQQLTNQKYEFPYCFFKRYCSIQMSKINKSQKKMQKLTIPITTTSAQQKILQITSKSALIKKRLVKTWTAQEDQKLVTLYDQYPKKWNIIAQHIKNRNENQCLHRFRRICRLGQSKKIWSPQQDQTVLKMINQVGHNWRVIAQKLGTKSGKQIRERFINKLDPNICRQQWTQDEDMKIIELYTKMGSKWCEISKALPGRPENRIKNRFYSYIQKNYEFKVRESLEQIKVEVKLEVVENKENASPRIAGVKFIQNKPPALLDRHQNPSGFSKVFLQREQNVRHECKFDQQQPPKQDPRSNQTIVKTEKMEQEKENNYNSMKEINEECYLKGQTGQNNNNDLLYFEDN